MRWRFYRLIDPIWDRIFLSFIIIAALALMIFIWLVEKVFPEHVERAMEKFFEPPKDEDVISGYRKFAKHHPCLAWLLKWPLLLFGL